MKGVTAKGQTAKEEPLFTIQPHLSAPCELYSAVSARIRNQVIVSHNSECWYCVSKWTFVKALLVYFIFYTIYIHIYVFYITYVCIILALIHIFFSYMCVYLCTCVYTYYRLSTSHCILIAFSVALLY